MNTSHQRHVDIVSSSIAVFTSLIIGFIIGFSYGYSLGSDELNE
jgi:ABC-type dipeptide/oligopeptide/nickel transport system permease subunit